MICELEKSLEAILCFHQGFLIKYSSTLSRLSIVTVSSPARNYNIWSSPTSSHLPPPGEGGENEKMISFLSKPNCTHIDMFDPMIESYSGLCLGQSLTHSLTQSLTLSTIFFTKRKGKHPCQLSVWQCRD